MHEKLNGEELDSARLRLGVKELDRQFVSYFRTKEEVASQEPEKWAGANLEDQRWMVAEALLKKGSPGLLLDVKLGYVGMSLADFGLATYNGQQVARDSDGPNSLNYVA